MTKEKYREYQRNYFYTNYKIPGTARWVTTKSTYFKRRCKEMAGYTCQICGSKEHIHCHHIIPWKYFLEDNGYTQDDILTFGKDIIREYNNPSNLMCVCAECHRDIHEKMRGENL